MVMKKSLYSAIILAILLGGLLYECYHIMFFKSWYYAFDKSYNLNEYYLVDPSCRDTLNTSYFTDNKLISAESKEIMFTSIPPNRLDDFSIYYIPNLEYIFVSPDNIYRETVQQGVYGINSISTVETLLKAPVRIGNKWKTEKCKKDPWAFDRKDICNSISKGKAITEITSIHGSAVAGNATYTNCIITEERSSIAYENDNERKPRVCRRYYCHKSGLVKEQYIDIINGNEILRKEIDLVERECRK